MNVQRHWLLSMYGTVWLHLVLGTFAGIGGGAVAGTAGFATGGVVQNVGNHIYFGDPLMSPKDYAIGFGISAVTGGVAGGITNKISGNKGTNFWTGKKIADPRISVGIPKVESVVDDLGNSVGGKLDLNPDPIKANYGVESKTHTPLWTQTSKMSSVKNAFGHWKKHGTEFPEFI